jgi:hypothetical protein
LRPGLFSPGLEEKLNVYGGPQFSLATAFVILAPIRFPNAHVYLLIGNINITFLELF